MKKILITKTESIKNENINKKLKINKILVEKNKSFYHEFLLEYYKNNKDKNITVKYILLDIYTLKEVADFEKLSDLGKAIETQNNQMETMGLYPNAKTGKRRMATVNKSYFIGLKYIGLEYDIELKDGSNFSEEEYVSELSNIAIINKKQIMPYSEEELNFLSKSDFNSKNNKYSIKNRIDTSNRLKATRLFKANYLCEINNCHTTFTNSTGVHQFMEVHHIIPLSAQDDFSYNLDNIYNLISVCPNCHRQMHYGSYEDKKKIFYEMYKIRENEINLNKIEIDEIFNKYYS